MSKLRELEVRMREALTAREQGRIEDALAACRSVLEIAPHHLEGNKLMAALGAPMRTGGQRTSQVAAEPATLTGEDIAAYTDRSSSPGHDTPNITRKVPTLSPDELDGAITPAPLPADDEPDDFDERADTNDLALDDEHTDQHVVLEQRGKRGGGESKISPFLAPLPHQVRSNVLARFVHKVVAAGTFVIRRGESQHPLVLVHKGRLDVRVESADGVAVQLASLTVGEYIGEGALLERKPASAHVVAATDAEVLLLSPNDFYEIAAAYPALWAELKDSAERRRREQDRRARGR